MTLRPQTLALGAFLVAGVPLLGGCVTQVTGELATETSQGFRYALPIPVLKVTPQADGTMAVEVFYIPDPKNTYVLQAKSIVGAYTLEVKTNQGLLDTVTFNPDATGVADQAISSYGDIQKAKVDAKAQADKDAAAKADDKAKAAAAAAQAIKDAQTTLDVATAKRDKLVALNVTGDQLVAAELAIVDASTRLDALKAEAQASATSSAMNKAANKASAFDQAGAKFDTAAGPVFYRLEPDATTPGKVNLVDFVQLNEKTAKPVTPGPPPPDLAYSMVGASVIRPGKNGLTFKVKINRTFKSIDHSSVKLTADTPGPTLRPVTVDLSDDGGLLVTLDDHQAPGAYHLAFTLILDKDGKTAEADPVGFEVRPKMGK